MNPLLTHTPYRIDLGSIALNRESQDLAATRSTQTAGSQKSTQINEATNINTQNTQTSETPSNNASISSATERTWLASVAPAVAEADESTEPATNQK